MPCVGGGKTFLPSIHEKQHQTQKRFKQIIYTFGLFISSLPLMPLIKHGRMQTKLKQKVDNYIS